MNDKTFAERFGTPEHPEGHPALIANALMQAEAENVKLQKTLKQKETETKKIKKILKKLVSFDDLMHDDSYDESGTYAGAYYAYYKGKSEIWDEARRILSNVHSEPQQKE